MKPSIQNLGQILYAPAQYVIPVFQRNYRWERPQWEKLWESLVDIQHPDKRGNHFMGFLVFVPGLAQPGQHTTFHLIDGQQRLSTSSILLIAVRNVARRHGLTDLAEEVHGYYLVHPLKTGDQHFRLFPKERDHDAYIALVQGKGASGRMSDALDYFDQQCELVAQESPSSLRALFDTMCQRLEFMCATLEAENAYNIFKSLNSTGVPLGPADLIRNFVFMHVAPDEQDEFDRQYWSELESRFARSDGSFDEERFSRFFRDHLMSAGKYVSPKDTFHAFEARFEATEFSPQDLAVSLGCAARNYAVISGEERDESDAVSNALEGLNQLDSSTTYPVLLALFNMRANGALDSQRLARAIDMLRGFILRRFICGESSRGYGRMFVRALARNECDPVIALDTYLLERGWPDDRRFIEAFAVFPLYSRQYASEILEAMERARGHKEAANLQNAQVEHVMPQTLNDAWRTALGPDAERVHTDWLHRPGNLTLSGYNPELWNHPFDVKRRRYADSNIVLTREIASSEVWTEEQIRSRGERMAAAAAEIWIGPAHPLPAEGTSAEAPRFEHRARFWRALREHLIKNSVDVPLFDSEDRRLMHVSVPSNVRYVGVRLKYSIEQSRVAIVVWFWRQESRRLWEELKAKPDEIDAMVKARWQFSEIPGRDRARMKIEQGGMQLREESAWLKAFQWFEGKLPLLYGEVLPAIRKALGQVEADAADPSQEAEEEELSAVDVLQEQCPEESQRHFLAAQLIRSVDLADSVATRSWAVTLFPNGFRLNVGAVEALTFIDGEIRVLISGEFSRGRMLDGEVSECPYKNAPQPAYAFQSSLLRYRQIADDLHEAHAAYIRGAAVSTLGRPRRSAFARHHSRELVDYARKLIA